MIVRVLRNVFPPGNVTPHPFVTLHMGLRGPNTGPCNISSKTELHITPHVMSLL